MMLALLLAIGAVDIDEHLGAKIPGDLPFSDESGRPVSIGDYFTGDRPVVLILAYFRCPMLCDLVLRGMAGAVKEQPLVLGRDFRALTVSIDPKDRPAQAALKQHNLLQAMNRPDAPWPFLTGKEQQIQQLAGALGFQYTYDPKSDQYAHPACAIVLTPDGRISRYLYGADFRPFDLRLALQEASRGRVGGIFDRVLLTCFRYDPATRRYAWAVRSAVARNGAAFGAGPPFRHCLVLAEARMSPINDWLRTALFLPPQATEVASQIDHLHYFVIIVTMLGSALVGFAAVGLTIRYLKPRDTVAQPEKPQKSPVAVEVAIAGGMFTLFITFWVIGFWQYERVRVPPENTYDIYVTGKQWMWEFSYREGHHSIATLVVPTGRPVRLLMTSRDVIHSFFVPDFRVKQDVIPGRYTSLWFEVKEPGRHPIYCAEFCGTNHSSMRGEVIALSPNDYARWLGNERENQASLFASEPSQVGELGASPPESLARHGVQVAADEGCLRCHTLDGSPHIGPTFANLYLKQVQLKGGGTVLADEEYLTESMMDPNVRIVSGYQPVMPSYLGRLRPAETAALVELIRSLQHVQPPAHLPPMTRPVEVGPSGPLPEKQP
jgi:cytochrome c oxidase subunit 2